MVSLLLFGLLFPCEIPFCGFSEAECERETPFRIGDLGIHPSNWEEFRNLGFSTEKVGRAYAFETARSRSVVEVVGVLNCWFECVRVSLYSNLELKRERKEYIQLTGPPSGSPCRQDRYLIL